ncbi:CdaR family protein [Hyunsoonleella aestuarii]|nr:YbbR-like domain-containing protein [Hyunsoonleella aestuarii]
MSFSILMFTKLSKNYTNTLAFKIEKINVPEEKVILNNSDSIVNVTLKTHGFKWFKYYLGRPTLTVDFSKDVAENNAVFICDNSNLEFIANRALTNQVELIKVSPKRLEFNFDVNLVKKVPVVLKSNIIFTQGFNISESYKLQPDSIKVIGPHSIAKKIEYVETEAVNLEDVKTNINRKVSLKKLDNELKLSTQSITLTAEVEKFTEGTLKIPVTISNVPEGISLKYFPKEVNISFYTSLARFNQVKAKDFRVVCDYSKVTENQSFFIPELVKRSTLVKTAKLNQQRIEFIILE